MSAARDKQIVQGPREMDLFGDTPAALGVTHSATSPATVAATDLLAASDGGATSASPPDYPTRGAGATHSVNTVDATADFASTTAPVARRTRGIAPAPPSNALLELSRALPATIHLGTSSWSFPGWDGLVYGAAYSNQALAKGGLRAYAAHPLLRSVSLDRSFYAPLTLAEYANYAAQTPEHFRFMVKAPSLVTDAVLRGTRGEPGSNNPCFLDVALAIREFVTPCIEGLGSRAGALVFQFSPLPREWLAAPGAWIERVGAFLAALPRLPDGVWYAVEIRDGALLTPRFIKMLQATGTRYCMAIHTRMPDAIRQAAALALLDAVTPGPLLVRWSLHAGFKYEQAKAKYEPFDRLVDEDLATRTALAQLAAHYAAAGQGVIITANNKAEGSAPLTCLKLAEQIVAVMSREPPSKPN